jgi:hypothetical protein
LDIALKNLVLSCRISMSVTMQNIHSRSYFLHFEEQSLKTE